MDADAIKKDKKNRRNITRTAITRKDLVDKHRIKKHKELDVFDIVANRKRDIEERDTVAQKREDVEILETEKRKDPIYRETCHSTFIKQERKYARRARVQEKRTKIIRKLTFNLMKCPSCKKTKVNPSYWIISKDEKKVICRSCFSSHGWRTQKQKPLNLSSIKLFENEIKRYRLDSLGFCRIRQSLTLTVKQFADLIGWSASYQYDLENGRWNTISEKTMKEICQVFSKKGIPIKLDFLGKPIIYFKIEGNLIRSARKLLNLSMVEFADKAGWDSQFQHKIETNKLKKISRDVAETLQKIITQ